jgi:hypothetical protein
MTNETPQTISVSDMLKKTGENTANFMIKVSEHIDTLEAEVIKLQQRIVELEGKASDPKPE